MPRRSIDQSILDESRNAMKQAIPEILETIKQRGKAASELRITPFYAVSFQD